jgi:hypothetical protein
MRTTVSVSDELLLAAKRMARQRGVSLGAVIDDALRRELAVAPQSADRPVVPVFTGGAGPTPGVDLSSNRALAEVLDADTPLDRLR